MEKEAFRVELNAQGPHLLKNEPKVCPYGICDEDIKFSDNAVPICHNIMNIGLCCCQIYVFAMAELISRRSWIEEGLKKSVPEPGAGSEEKYKYQEQDEGDVDGENSEHPLCDECACKVNEMRSSISQTS